MKKILLLILVLAGCATTTPRAPEPAKSIDVQRFYTGRWYEIGRTPMKLTDGCVAGTTDYSRDAAGRLIQRDACRMGTPEGEEKLYWGPVTILNPDAATKVSVRYTVWGFIPVTWTYWMLDHGENYEWFITSDPAFENVSVFTRTPRPSPEVVEMLKGRTRELGYDPGRLEFPTPFPRNP